MTDQSQKPSLYQASIQASNEFYLADINRKVQNYPSSHISKDDLEKKERKYKYMKEVQNMKSQLDKLLKENIELYRAHKSIDFYSKKSQQLQQYIQCQQDLIGQITILDKKEQQIMLKCEEINESLQMIESINNISSEQTNLKGFLNQIQLENEKSLHLLNKELK